MMHTSTFFIALLAGSSFVSASPIAKHKTKVSHKTVTKTDKVSSSTTFDLGGIATSALVSGPMVTAAVTKRHEDHREYREDRREDRHRNVTRPEHHRGNRSQDDASDENIQRRAMPIEIDDETPVADSKVVMNDRLNSTRPPFSRGPQIQYAGAGEASPVQRRAMPIEVDSDDAPVPDSKVVMNDRLNSTRPHFYRGPQIQDGVAAAGSLIQRRSVPTAVADFDPNDAFNATEDARVHIPSAVLSPVEATGVVSASGSMDTLAVQGPEIEVEGSDDE